jgi:hypothetical protein
VIEGSATAVVRVRGWRGDGVARQPAVVTNRAGEGSFVTLPVKSAIGFASGSPVSKARK